MIDFLEETAVRAGAAILAVRGRAKVWAKGDGSPVTEADWAASRVIGDALTKRFPDIPIVVEEEAVSHALENRDRFFLVDPLDGTKEFTQGREDFTVNIALIEEGAPVVGVVYAPAKERLWAGDRRSGERPCAFVRRPGEERRPIAIRRHQGGALAVVASKSHRDAATDAYIARYDVGRFESAGSSLKFCLLAEGAADLYPRLGRTMEWDTAAGHAVLLAAGGSVRLFSDPTRKLSYGKKGFENPFFVAHVPGVELIV